MRWLSFREFLPYDAVCCVFVSRPAGMCFLIQLVMIINPLP